MNGLPRPYFIVRMPKFAYTQNWSILKDFVYKEDMSILFVNGAYTYEIV